MKDEGKTKKQLINELVELRRCIIELEASEAERKQAEVLMEMHRRQNELILNSAGEGIFGLDLNGNHTFVNPSAARMLGYEVEELVGYHSHTIWHHPKADGSPYPEDECPIYASYNDEAIYSRDDEVFWRKDGTSFPVRYTSTPIREGDKLTGAVVVFRDITERKMAEEKICRLNKELGQRIIERTAQLEATNKELKNEITERKQIEMVLKKSKELYQRFFDSSSDDVLLKDENFKLLIVNKSYKERMGKKEEEALGKTAFDLLPRETAEGCTTSDVEALKSDSVLLSEEQLGDRIFETRKFRVNLGDDKFGVGGYIRDITERKQIEEALRVTNETLQSLVKASPLAIIILDSDGNVKLWNPAAENIFGWSEQEVLGKPHPIVPEDKQDEFRAYLNAVLKGNTFWEDEIIRQKKDGSLIDLSLSTALLRDTKGEVIGVLGIVADIAERKQAEEELKSSHEQLRNLYSSLQLLREENRIQLAREIHDELGQVLTALKMEFGLLNNELSTEQKYILQYTESLNHLIDRAIDTVQRICRELRPAMLDDLGLSAAIEWQAKEFEKWSDIKCEIIFEPEEIILDKEYSIALFRIFQEVLTNIARHAQATKVKISLKQKQGKVILSIKDNGTGITKEKISNHNSLGLIGIRERIHILGGSFIIRGIQGKGTTTTVSIPIKTR